jgi:hypothetical protein
LLKGKCWRKIAEGGKRIEGRTAEGKRIAEGELLPSLRVETLRELKREHETVKSAPRTLYIGFRKAKLKTSYRTWDSASLRTETLKVMHMQFLGTAVVVCKSEHRGF